MWQMKAKPLLISANIPATANVSIKKLIFFTFFILWSKSIIEMAK